MTQISPHEELDTQLVPLAGKQVEVRQPTDLQIMMLAREAKKITKESVPGDQKIIAVGTILDIMEALIVKQEDLEHIQDLVVKGQFRLTDMMSMIAVFIPKPQSAPVVRRGRPRKNPN